MSATAETTDETNETPPCVDRLCEVAGRDRVVAAALREQTARLIRLAEGLEINAAIGTAAAADLLAEDGP